MTEDSAQPQPTEPEQIQTPPVETVVPILDPVTSDPLPNDEPVKTEEPVVAPVESQSVVETSVIEEQAIPEIQITKEETSPLMTDPSHQPLPTHQSEARYGTSLRKEGTEEESVQQDRPDGESVTQPTEQPEPTGQAEPTERIVERIIEKEKALTPEYRKEIFKEELAEHLSEANRAKHDHYEKHLQNIVDFIRAKATLVTNQDIEEGLKMPDSTVTDRLNDLIARGLVTRIGEGRLAKYRLTQAL